MKKLILFSILFSAISADGQTLKEILYGGKLKSDTGTVVRKTDDLSTKIDTTTKKPVEPEKTKVASTSPGELIIQGDSVVVQSAVAQNDSGNANAVAAPKTNDEIWKGYLDQLIKDLKTEVLPSKKIKDGTYSVLIVYVIEVDGQISVNTVSTSPESSYLEDQVKQRLTLTAPQMTPLLTANGKPRKAIKRQTIILTK